MASASAWARDHVDDAVVIDGETWRIADVSTTHAAVILANGDGSSTKLVSAERVRDAYIANNSTSTGE